mgnify:CR=1 FL=1
MACQHGREGSRGGRVRDGELEAQAALAGLYNSTEAGAMVDPNNSTEAGAMVDTSAAAMLDPSDANAMLDPDQDEEKVARQRRRNKNKPQNMSEKAINISSKWSPRIPLNVLENLGNRPRGAQVRPEIAPEPPRHVSGTPREPTVSIKQQ